LTTVWTTFNNWLVSDGVKEHINEKCTNTIKQTFNTWQASPPTGDIATNPNPTNTDYFILKSISQVAVSQNTFPSLYLSTDTTTGGPKGAINAVHGTTTCYELGWVRRNPDPKRWASPVFIRFHKVKINGQEEFCPVMTWCKQNGIPILLPPNDAKTYLKGIGFNNSLSGNPI
jgi:hypothetical protein